MLLSALENWANSGNSVPEPSSAPKSETRPYKTSFCPVKMLLAGTLENLANSGNSVPEPSSVPKSQTRPAPGGHAGELGQFGEFCPKRALKTSFCPVKMLLGGTLENWANSGNSVPEPSSVPKSQTRP